MSKISLHEPLDISSTSSESKTEGPFSDVISCTKEKFHELELKRKLFNRVFPTDMEEGFHMNQKTGNCYLIAPMNVMRLNSYFMENLYKNISFSKEDNIFETKVSYIFPDGEKITVSINDLKNQKEESEKYKFSIKKLGELNENILNEIVRKGDIQKLLDSGECKYHLDFRNKKRVVFTRDFMQKIKEEIISCDGEYYDLLQVEKEYKSVDAPIGYKILEALYTRKKSKIGNRKSMIGGKSINVFRDFISKNEWDLINYTFTNKSDIKSTLDILSDFDTNKYMITTAIGSNINYPNMTFYFSYNDYKMADGHAYSIVGFDKEKEEVEIVNPWDNNKSMFFSKDDFFKIFLNITIARRKE